MAGKGFSYQKTDKIFVSYYKDGQWDNGTLVDDDQITLSIMSTVFHYGQSVFEGLKAYRRKDGAVQLFRIKDNAERFKKSCERIVMPPLPEERFVESVIKTVSANKAYVPAYKQGTLYVRPVMFGVGDNLGLKPSQQYMFAVITSPVGSYFDSQQKGMNLVITDFDRVAPHGMGKAKTGGNYAASMLAQKNARDAGYADVLFLDPLEHKYIEEVGAANFIGIKGQDTLMTPVSSSILNGITKRSVLFLAKHFLNLTVVETIIPFCEIDQFDEAAACGTAAVITPIGSITEGNTKHQFKYHEQMGPITAKLYEMLTSVQYGDIDDPDNWITLIE